jgi:hypothetical protein
MASHDETSYLAMKLMPRDTGLPFAVWITNNDNYPHDVRVKVSLLRGGKGNWSDAVPVALRPEIRDITGNLAATDLALVRAWLELNRDAVVDYWNDDIDSRDIWSKLRSV